ATVEAIIGAGGKLGFVNLDVNPATKEGEFMLNTWLGMAHMQWRGHKERWATVRKRAVERGAFLGPTPLGYRRSKDRTLEVDPTDGPLLGEAFVYSAFGGGLQP